MTTELQSIIDNAFDNRELVKEAATKQAIIASIELLDSGKARVAEKTNGEWVVNQWLKKAVLLSFGIRDNEIIDGGETNYFDKVPSKFADYDQARFQQEGFRVVPPAAVRKGSYIAENVVLMPSYVNIGAYVDLSLIHI